MMFDMFDPDTEELVTTGIGRKNDDAPKKGAVIPGSLDVSGWADQTIQIRVQQTNRFKEILWLGEGYGTNNVSGHGEELGQATPALIFAAAGFLYLMAFFIFSCRHYKGFSGTV